jgi:transposase InsO family protein
VRASDSARRPWTSTTSRAANALARQFDAARPNQRWVGDTTEFSIGCSAKLYLSAILDLYSRFIVGWAVSAVNDRHLVLRALDMSQAPMPGGWPPPSTRIKAARTPVRWEFLTKDCSQTGRTSEGFYNQGRRHSTLGQISLAEFERRAGHAA